MMQDAGARDRGRYRAAVIGHTGRGNYGHGLDAVLVGLPGVGPVAVADPDEAGRQRAQALTHAPRGYADHHELLERERPELLVIAPRQPDQREPMFLAAARAGVKAIYCEKPFARSLDEADRMLAACDARGIKVVVAHQNRVSPAPVLARELIRRGKVGRLRAIRAYGKQDHRGGGQDLIVLGTHMLDLMRSLAGPARWCHARVLQDGEEATPAAIRPGEEQVGLVAGDDLIAEYGFDHGITGSYESVRLPEDVQGSYFRMELCGTTGILVLWSGAGSPLYYLPRPYALPDAPPDQSVGAQPGAGRWQRLYPEPAADETPAGQGGGRQTENQALVRGLLASVEMDSEPTASGHEARAALEMILAVYEAHIQGGRVRLPLVDRTHPLSRWGA
jgi:predicted dehydrogenase